MRETLHLIPGYGSDLEPTTVTVEYVERPHWDTTPRKNGKLAKAYDVLLEGETVGQVEQVEYVSHGEYKGTRIRRDYGTCLEWSWRNAKTGRTNSPGLYAGTRRSAVAKLLGYTHGRKEQ